LCLNSAFFKIILEDKLLEIKLKVILP
jgi:hypothetical protein